MSLLALCSPLVAAEQKLRGVLLSGGTTEDRQQEQVLVEEELLHRDVARELSIAGVHDEHITVYNGHWGGWKPWVNGSDGKFACGAELRFETSQGIGDDTGANGLKFMFCDLNDWEDQYQAVVWGGSWGNWKGMKMCPNGKYMAAARVRFEDPIGGGDDTALNGLEIYCTKPDWNDGETLVVYPGLWGSWKPWAYRYSKLVKGARVRYEDPIGWGDDTALNGVMMDVAYPYQE